MFANSSPPLSPRYWVIICLASICGANLGDSFPDILHITPLPTLVLLTASFAALTVVHSLAKRRLELLFWAAILVVRAAATVLADYSIGGAQLGYAPATAVLAVTLVVCVALTGGAVSSTLAPTAPRLTAAYWICMLAAGTLGTVIADGVGHAFNNVKIGVPFAAIAGTVLLAAVFPLRTRVGWAFWSYWVAVVVIRSWGTSVGDIAKFLASLPISLSVSAVALLLTVLFWRPAEPAVEETTRAAA